MSWCRKTLTVIAAGAMLVSFPGCSKKVENPGQPAPIVPVVTTNLVTSILTDTATCGGTVTSDGGASVTARGVCWGLTTGPQISGSHTVDGTGTGSFTSLVTGLLSDTLYHIRAYATNTAGISYGNELSFRTLKPVVYSVADIDGNAYPIVKIGNQYWLKKNLRVTRYRNGDAIARVAADAQWKILTSGGLCSYDNDATNDTVYGSLYNWYALSDSRGLCPEGWHVPSDAEWKSLGNFLGGNMVAGGKMKSTGTLEQSSGLWFLPNTSATNSSGFTGLPGGYRINYGTYYSMGNVGYFWSASDTATVNGWNYVLDANNGELKMIFNLKTNGFSVRCCKD